MNNPNPFVPRGSLLERQTQRRSRLKITVACIVAVGVTGLVAMLIQGCKREQPQSESEFSVMDTNPPAVETNPLPPPPMTAESNTAAITPPPMTPPPEVVVPPTPTPATTPAPTTATGSEYEVVKGDTLSRIAKNHGISLRALEDANPGVDPRRLKIHQKLVIPAPTTTASGMTSSMSEMGGNVYVVKSGDTLTKIAHRNGTTVKALEAANPNVDPNHIKVGQKLNLPGQAETAVPASVETTPTVPTIPPPVVPAMTN